MKRAISVLFCLAITVIVSGATPTVAQAAQVEVKATLTCENGQVIVKTITCQEYDTVVATADCGDGTHATATATCPVGGGEISWSDQLKIDATFMAGAKVGTGAMSSLQLAMTWFPAGGEHGLRLFGGVGYSFEPYHFVGGLEYVFRNGGWELGLGLSTHNFKSPDFRFANTVLSGMGELRRDVTGPLFLSFQTHFGAIWDNDGNRDHFVGLFGGLGVRFWE